MESRARITLSRSALKKNYLELLRLNQERPLLPMIKANAYGHGLSWTAQTLKGSKNLFGFGVATLEEGLEARKAIKGRTPILVFSGCMPVTQDSMILCKRFDLTPVISSMADLKKIRRLAPKLGFHLEVNTGMNRMGIEPHELDEALKHSQPLGVFSHLAQSELPKSALTQKQVKHYKELAKKVRNLQPQALLHFFNSAGIYHSKTYGLEEWTDLSRPGLSLYGVSPWANKKTQLQNVAKVEFQVLQTYTLNKGDRVGYGGTFVAPKNRFPMAIIGGGYADGIGWHTPPRPAFVKKGKTKLPFLGRVSMDLTAVSNKAKLKPGQWVEFLGKHVDPWEQAKALGTTPYELLTSMGTRSHWIHT